VDREQETIALDWEIKIVFGMSAREEEPPGRFVFAPDENGTRPSLVSCGAESWM
jgi:hypothetical protein